MVVLYTKKDDIVHYLLFQDRKSQDWSFISGGCKPNETFLECAFRELEEESRHLFHAGCVIPTYFFTFRTTFRPYYTQDYIYEEEIRHTTPQITRKYRRRPLRTLYNVFFMELDESIDISTVCTVFENTEPQCACENENSHCQFFTANIIPQLQLWNFLTRPQSQIDRPHCSILDTVLSFSLC